MINKIKLLLGENDVDNIPEDTILEVYVNRAITSIVKYLNNDKITKDIVNIQFEDAVILLVETAYNTKDSKNYKSQGTGKRSETLRDNLWLNDDVKSLLPKPYVRMM